MWCNSQGVRSRKSRTSQNEAENQFFGLILVFSKNAKKTVIFLMHYNALFHWSEFRTKFDHILAGYVQKPAKKQPKFVLSAGMKTF